MDILQKCKSDYFLTGSKGILGEDFGNDYDFVLHASEMPLGVTADQCLDLRRYIKVMPLGNSFLYKGVQGIDLLIYEDVRDVENMKATTRELQSMVGMFPSMREYLMDKDNRVRIFEFILRRNKVQTLKREDLF